MRRCYLLFIIKHEEILQYGSIPLAIDINQLIVSLTGGFLFIDRDGWYSLETGYMEVRSMTVLFGGRLSGVECGEGYMDQVR